MKTVVKSGYIFFSIIFLLYLLIPNPSFPKKPGDALQSDETADTEDVQRKAYFTNLNRYEVMQYYVEITQKNYLYNINLPTYRLNYPPEEAQTIIRDQTRSTFLEEIVYPFRESYFINGFEPKDSKDIILIKNRIWKQKIIVRQNESNIYVRFILGLISLVLIYIIYYNISISLRELRKELPKLWIFR